MQQLLDFTQVLLVKCDSKECLGLGFAKEKRLLNYYMNGNDAFRLKLWITPPYDEYAPQPQKAPPTTSGTKPKAKKKKRGQIQEESAISSQQESKEA
jgi:hypothetical protein